MLIPQEVSQELDIAEGDILEAQVENGRLVYTPKILVGKKSRCSKTGFRTAKRKNTLLMLGIGLLDRPIVISEVFKFHFCYLSILIAYSVEDGIFCQKRAENFEKGIKEIQDTKTCYRAYTTPFFC